MHEDLERRGWHEEAGCDCPAIRAQMNAWGIEGCREPENLAWIVGEMLKEARRRKIKRARLPGAGLYCRRLVLSAVRQAEKARRLPIRRLRRSTERGVVTGGRALHWPCLGALAIAAARQGLGLAVADHGLEAWQRAELDRVGVRWIEHDRPEIGHANQRSGTISDAKAWWKPWVCAASPFDASIWIDADAVVTGDLAPLFERLEAGGLRLEEGQTPALHPLTPSPPHPSFVSTQRRFMRDSNGLYAELFRHFFGAAAIEIVPRFAPLNTGVLGWRRGDPLIADWQRWCLRVLGDDEALRLCKVRDQSAFLLVVLDRALRSPASSLQPPALLDDDRWNWPADGYSAEHIRRRRPVPLDPAKLLAAAEQRNPGAAIVHWLGRQKPWGPAAGAPPRRKTDAQQAPEPG